MRGRGHDAGLGSLEGEGSGPRGDERGELAHRVERRGFDSVEGVGVAGKETRDVEFSMSETEYNTRRSGTHGTL